MLSFRRRSVPSVSTPPAARCGIPNGLAQDPATAIRVAAVLAGLLMLGCSPALDWREVRVAPAAVMLTFPCKPSAQERSLKLAGQPVRLALHACTASDQTFGLAHADVKDPALVGPVLQELVGAVQLNLRAGPSPSRPFAVAGSTPQAHAQRLRLSGSTPQGQALHMDVAVFSKGTRVFQVSALGARLSDEAARTFFDSIRFEP